MNSYLLHVKEWGDPDDCGRISIVAVILDEYSAVDSDYDCLAILLPSSVNSYLITEDKIYQIWRNRTYRDLDQLISIEAEVRPAHLATAVGAELRNMASSIFSTA